jgi:hypothetical protein
MGINPLFRVFTAKPKSVDFCIGKSTPSRARVSACGNFRGNWKVNRLRAVFTDHLFVTDRQKT